MRRLKPIINAGSENVYTITAECRKILGSVIGCISGVSTWVSVVSVKTPLYINSAV